MTKILRSHRVFQGGQTFARASRGPRHTVVPTVSFSLAESKRILSKCKSHGSTIASALFALSNLAYIRSTPADRMLKALPTNFYSALNVRGILCGQERKDPYHLAIGYYKLSSSILSRSSTEQNR